MFLFERTVCGRNSLTTEKHQWFGVTGEIHGTDNSTKKIARWLVQKTESNIPRHSLKEAQIRGGRYKLTRH